MDPIRIRINNVIERDIMREKIEFRLRMYLIVFTTLLVAALSGLVKRE